MLEIIILIVLIVRIVRYANLKQMNPLKWGILLALNWLMFELLGIILAMYLLNIELNEEFIKGNPGYIILLSCFGIGCGFLGYFVTKRMIDRSVL
jgi:hypothetical protein